MTKKYLVTGGAGFVGSHIVELLLEANCSVVVLDNFSTGRRCNLPESDGRHLNIVEGDISDFDVVKDAMCGVDGVFHQAALVSVQASVDEPCESFRNNTMGTFNVFEAARQHGVGKVVYASSAAVYGQSDSLPLKEVEPKSPLSPYALDKVYAENLAGVYALNYGIKSVGLRYFNIYGPRQLPDSEYSGVISIFVDRLMNGNPATIFGDGEQTRDFVYVEDVAKANLAAMDKLSQFGGADVYNCGSGCSITINELYEQIATVTGSRVAPDYGPARDAEVKLSCADIGALQSGTSWRPRVALGEGLQQLKDYMAAQYR